MSISVLGSTSAIPCCTTSHSAGRSLSYAEASQTWNSTHTQSRSNSNRDNTEFTKLQLLLTEFGLLLLRQFRQNKQHKHNSPCIIQQPNLFNAERERPLSGHQCTSGPRRKAKLAMEVTGSPLGQSKASCLPGLSQGLQNMQKQ